MRPPSRVEIAVAYAEASELTAKARAAASVARAALQHATDDNTRRAAELAERSRIETELLRELVAALKADGLLEGGEVPR